MPFIAHLMIDSVRIHIFAYHH